MSPIANWPSSTKCPPYQMIATNERVGSRSMRGMKPARNFAARKACLSTPSAASSRRFTCNLSAPKPLRIRMPDKDSSTTPERPESSSCRARFAGVIRVENRVAARFKSGSSPSASTARTTLFIIMMMSTPIMVSMLAAVSGSRMTTVLIC